MVVSVLALMSTIILGDVLINWHCLNVGKSVRIDVNQTSMEVCGNKFLL